MCAAMSTGSIFAPHMHDHDSPGATLHQRRHPVHRDITRSNNGLAIVQRFFFAVPLRVTLPLPP